jgi:integrase/recombinase XerD
MTSGKAHQQMRDDGVAKVGYHSRRSNYRFVGRLAAPRWRYDDINWNEGTLRLGGTKARRVDTLPLPAPTGAAIAAYLRDERPRTSNRAIFVRHVAPYDTPIDSGVVQRAVRAAYKRCGWKRSRVQIIRHSVASRLLRAGTPMKEIADVLRHRSLDTSAIYIKVDLSRLASVALPWPGSAS